jgi:hypothetical protein
MIMKRMATFSKQPAPIWRIAKEVILAAVMVIVFVGLLTLEWWLPAILTA